MKRKIPAAIAVAVEFVAFSSFIVPAIDFYKLGGLIQAVILCVAMGVMSATWKTIAGTWQKVEEGKEDKPPSKKKVVIGIIFALWLLGGLIYSFWRADRKDVCRATIGVPTQSETKQARSDEPRPKKASSLDFDSMSNEELMRIASSGKPKQQAQNDDFPDVAKAEKDMMETFINGASLIDAINLHGDRPDPSLAKYESATGDAPFEKAKKRNTKYATDVLIRYAELAGFPVCYIEAAKIASGGDPYKMYDFLQGLAEKHLAK